MKKIVISVFAFWFLLVFCSKSFAGEVDILVRKLVEKGILTEEEAQQVLTETREELKKEAEEQKQMAAKGEVPEWVKNIKLKGDFRLRYQWEDETGKAERNRERIRLRLGAVTKIADIWEVGFGLATGGDDPRSTNETLDNTFESPDIRLDYAYAEAHLCDWLSIWGGKYKGIKKAIFRPSDLLWDSDLRPEGLGVKFNYQPENYKLGIFANTGLWILDEVSSGSDPLMFYIQPGVKWNLTDNVSFKTACAYYAVSSVKGHTLDHSSNTNTLSNGGLKYDYDVFSPSMELEFKNLTELVPYIAVFGDYVNNSDSNDDGYLLGIKFGDKKVKERGQWQFKYMYRRLERDAWLDVFPDSDAFGGKTDIKGHEVVFQYGLAKHVTFGLDYYHCERISSDKDQDLLQVDLEYKF